MSETEVSERRAELRALLDDEQREVFETLLEQEPRPLGELRDEVVAYLMHVRRAAEKSNVVDLEMAEAIGDAARALIRHFRSRRDDEEAQRLIHAAVLYFILEDDAEDDLASVIGFDDDAEVISAVAVVLDRPDLTVIDLF